MEPKDNPYLQIEDPYANVKNKKDDASKAQMEFMALCWRVFHVDADGKRIMELMKERYLMRPLFNPEHPNCKELALYWGGFCEAIRGFYNLGLQHQQYINGVEAIGRNTTSNAGST